MSFYNPLDYERIEVQLPCEFCGAEPGQWCRAVRSGRPTAWLHMARSHIWHERHPSNRERAQLAFPCDYCHALPGEWCRVHPPLERPTRRLNNLHTARLRRVEWATHIKEMAT